MSQAKKFIGILAACGVLSVGAQATMAQTEPAPSASRGPAAMKRGKPDMYGPEYRLDMMTRRLGLSEEQQAKIKPILVEEDQQLKALRGNQSYNRDERRARLQELNNSTFEKISPVLTPEQLKKHEQAKKIIREKRSNIRSSRPGPNQESVDTDKRIKRLTLDLDLTTEQQAKIKPLLAEENAQLDTLRGNDTYNSEQRRVKLQELNQITSDKIRPLLTAEQQVKFDKIKSKIVERRNQIKNPNNIKP
jgi:Spy/CpxP family protein refolding chaperone